MPILDAVFSKLGRPAGRALDPTIRDIVHSVLKEHGYASPAEVQALRDEVRDMRGRVDGMQKRLDEVVALADRARGEASATREAAEARSLAAERGANERVTAMAERLAQLEARLSEAASPRGAVPARGAARPELGLAAARCRVDGCKNDVRSKGFCSSHYQQWRRGTLKNFVGPEGHVMVDGNAYQVPASFAAGKAELRSGKIYVDGVRA
ncbi:MAG: hypothetical protein FJ090_18200 [Deltaproteobacteria bacterium]|nr:hypothetical protein [Deltaproteobacteria bacterium]